MLPPNSRRLLTFIVLVSLAAFSQAPQTDQIQIAPPIEQAQSPSKDATPEQLEKQGDALRARSGYLDSIDYYRLAITKAPQSAALSNKVGIAELMLQRYREATKDFQQAIKKDSKFAEPHNNLGVTYYEKHKYGPAIKEYKKAIDLDPNSASFHSNLGAAYFARKDFDRASEAYAEAIRLDPNIFEHTMRAGIAAQVASAEDRAHYDYVLAKLYAKIGDRDHSLEYLRKAMEEGYKGVKDVYTDPEFAELRKDARFTDLMKQKPPAIPE